VAAEPGSLQRAELYRRLAVVVAQELASEGLRAEFAAACERVVERERALELLDAEEVGAWLGVPAKSVHGLRKSGALPAVQVGKHWRWRRGDVARFVLSGSATVSNGSDRGGGA
jgi:hypothetical protein